MDSLRDTLVFVLREAFIAGAEARQQGCSRLSAEEYTQCFADVVAQYQAPSIATSCYWAYCRGYERAA